MQGAYPSGIFPGIKPERSVIKKVNLETAVAVVGVHWATNRPVSISPSLCLSAPPPLPPPATLVAIIMTRKASNTSLLYTSPGADG